MKKSLKNITSWNTESEYQQKKINLLLKDLNIFIDFIENKFDFTRQYSFNEIYLWLEKNSCEECIEYVVSMMMEPFDDIINPLINKMSSEEEKYFNIPADRTIIELKKILENQYSKILNIDFLEKKNNQNFWFISKNKEEPRLADRFKENGSELEQPLAIARDIKKLYEQLNLFKNSSTVDKFLAKCPEFRHIDMLRLKLSFFGALKFDPRSDKWLRICMFQGAPLPEQLNDYDDYWVYNSIN